MTALLLGGFGSASFLAARVGPVTLLLRAVDIVIGCGFFLLGACLLACRPRGSTGASCGQKARNQALKPWKIGVLSGLSVQ
jgi:hypothetical protein